MLDPTPWKLANLAFISVLSTGTHIEQIGDELFRNYSTPLPLWRTTPKNQLCNQIAAVKMYYFR
jgi:hypothetical protein